MNASKSERVFVLVVNTHVLVSTTYSHERIHPVEKAITQVALVSLVAEIAIECDPK